MGGSFFYLAIFMGIYILLFFPIYIVGVGYYDAFNKKCAFSLNLYKIFPVYGGYITLYSQGIVVHRSQNMADLIAYKDLKTEQQRFSFIKTFEFINFNIQIETNAEYFIFFDLIRRVCGILKPCLSSLKKTNLRLRVVENKTLKTSAKITLFFNGFILLTDLILFLWRKIKELWLVKTRKSTI
jgi:hypothetical protein